MTHRILNYHSDLFHRGIPFVQNSGTFIYLFFSPTPLSLYVLSPRISLFCYALSKHQRKGREYEDVNGQLARLQRVPISPWIASSPESSSAPQTHAMDLYAFSHIVTAFWSRLPWGKQLFRGKLQGIAHPIHNLAYLNLSINICKSLLLEHFLSLPFQLHFTLITFK